jgi:large subunit ribosomal protein L30
MNSRQRQYENTMSKLKITQTKSWIKCPKRQKATLTGLGLGRIGRTVEHNATPQIQGMVAKVAHLVKVEQL